MDRKPRQHQARKPRPPKVERPTEPVDGFQRLLACIVEPSRYRVLMALAEGDRCVTEVASAVGLSQSCTSRHLQTLQRAGVLERLRDGKRVLFRIDTRDSERASVLEWVMLRGDPRGAADGAIVHRGALGAPERATVLSRLPVAVRRGAPRPAVPPGPGSRPAIESPASPPAGGPRLAHEHATLPGSAEPDVHADEPAPRDELEDYLL